MNQRFAKAALVAALLSSGTAAFAAGKSDSDDGAVQDAQFAWKLFVQAMTPTSGGGLTFESWTEQCALQPQLVGCPAPSATAEKKGRTLHPSPLAHRMAAKTGRKLSAVTANGVECNAMNTDGFSGFPPPKNLSGSAQFCEEVYVNPPEVQFVQQNGLATLSGQWTYANAHNAEITFPTESIEVKADWVPTSSFTNPNFQCPDPTDSLYTETINGTCYALVGIHITSKEKPDWVWATFEPASAVTNPNRCDPKLYDDCFDPWGSTSKLPYGKEQAGKVKQSTQLQQLMSGANLNKAFGNYYLTAVQTQFRDGRSKAIPLGNSFVEFNAQVPPHQASCITCHKYAYYDGVAPPAGSPENNFGSAPSTGGWPNVGYACNKNQMQNCTPVTPKSISQDFSWMLGLMPAGATTAAPAEHK